MKIKDLPDNTNLGGIKFHDPKTDTTGYWYSQWDYNEGGAGVFYKEHMESTRIFPLCLNSLKEALEFDVIEENKNG
jgi:hypothetical protein